MNISDLQNDALFNAFMQQVFASALMSADPYLQYPFGPRYATDVEAEAKAQEEEKRSLAEQLARSCLSQHSGPITIEEAIAPIPKNMVHIPQHAMTPRQMMEYDKRESVQMSHRVRMFRIELEQFDDDIYGRKEAIIRFGLRGFETSMGSDWFEKMRKRPLDYATPSQIYENSPDPWGRTPYGPTATKGKSSHQRVKSGESQKFEASNFTDTEAYAQVSGMSKSGFASLYDAWEYSAFMHDAMEYEAQRTGQKVEDIAAIDWTNEDGFREYMEAKVEKVGGSFAFKREDGSKTDDVDKSQQKQKNKLERDLKGAVEAAKKPFATVMSTSHSGHDLENSDFIDGEEDEVDEWEYDNVHNKAIWGTERRQGGTADRFFPAGNPFAAMNSVATPWTGSKVEKKKAPQTKCSQSLDGIADKKDAESKREIDDKGTKISSIQRNATSTPTKTTTPRSTAFTSGVAHNLAKVFAQASPRGSPAAHPRTGVVALGLGLASSPLAVRKNSLAVNLNSDPNLPEDVKGDWAEVPDDSMPNSGGLRSQKKRSRPDLGKRKDRESASGGTPNEQATNRKKPSESKSKSAPKAKRLNTTNAAWGAYGGNSAELMWQPLKPDLTQAELSKKEKKMVVHVFKKPFMPSMRPHRDCWHGHHHT